MLKEKLLCSNLTLIRVKDNTRFSLNLSGAQYTSEEEITDDGIVVTETITATANIDAQPNDIIERYTRYIALVNNQRLVGTARYPLIKTLSISNGILSLTLERQSPKI